MVTSESSTRRAGSMGPTHRPDAWAECMNHSLSSSPSSSLFQVDEYTTYLIIENKTKNKNKINRNHPVLGWEQIQSPTYLRAAPPRGHTDRTGNYHPASSAVLFFNATCFNQTRPVKHTDNHLGALLGNRLPKCIMTLSSRSIVLPHGNRVSPWRHMALSCP